MPALPWTERTAIEPDHEYVAMASRLPLRRHRSIPGFMRDTMRIRHQLGETPGLVGYGLNAKPLRKTFWTFSVWQDQASLDSFATSDPHREITQRLQPRMDRTQFDFFPIAARDAPMAWDAIIARLERSSPHAGPPSPEQGH